MTPALRTTAIIGVVFIIGACTKVGHLQQTSPVRSLQFAGSHKAVAQCIHQRLGGRVQDDAFGEKYIIYDSAKAHATQGLTHYAITVGRSGSDDGFAEWRIARPATSGQFGAPQLSVDAVNAYWVPVQECAAQAKSAR